MSRFHAVPVLALFILAAGCDSTGPESGARVAIRFASASVPAGANAVNSAGEFALEGSNGTLTLSDVHFIVDEIELERVDGACDAGGTASSGASYDGDHHGEDETECEEFSAGPLFVGLDLGGEVPVVSQEVPPGTYTRLKFKVEDTEMEEGDDHAANLPDLMQAIHDAGFADWPSKASMVVTGVFTPAGEAPRPFTAYFEAELRIRKMFDPPLDVADAPSTVTIEVDPSLWFRTSNGAVLDLSAYDWATTQHVVEFEAQLGDGFHRMHYEHD